jgi:hypothetical protein
MASRSSERYRFMLDAFILLCLLVTVVCRVSILKGETDEQRTSAATPPDPAPRGAEVHVHYVQEIVGKEGESVHRESDNPEARPTDSSGEGTVIYPE